MFSLTLTANSVVTRSWDLLDGYQQRKVVVALLLTFMNAFIDVLGLASILPILYLASDATNIHDNRGVSMLYEWSGVRNENEFVATLLVCLVLVFIFKNAASILIVRHQSRIAYGLAVQLIDRQFYSYMNRGYEYFKENNSNYILRDIATLPTEFATNIVLPLLMLTTEVLVLTFISVGLIVFNVKVFLLLMVTLLPVLLVFSRVIRMRIQQLGREKNELRPLTFKLLFQAIHGYAEVRLSNSESHFVNASHSALRRFYAILTRLYVFENLPSRMIESAAIMAIAIIYIITTSLGAQSSEVIALLVVFATAAYRLMPSMNRILNAMVKVKEYSYVFESLDAKEVQRKSNVAASHQGPLRFEDEISLERISFQYKDTRKLILDDVSLKIHKGQTIGFVGASGSGKSTLMHIFMRLLEQTSGIMTIDGVLVDANNRSSWTCQIGYVQQNFYLLDGSLAENIAFGESIEKIDRDRVLICTQLAQLEGLVQTLPSGIDTKVGEFGAKLSGGQRQRIAIARALYRDVSVLVFDEATSALDSATERDVMDTISHISGLDKTILIVAHRITTLSNCDLIYEMKDGRIARMLGYDELVAERAFS